MDAINKFLGIRPSILPEQQETSTNQISQVATSAIVPDTFETLPQDSLGFESVMTTMNIAGDGMETQTPQTETIEASSVFDFISANIPAHHRQ